MSYIASQLGLSLFIGEEEFTGMYIGSGTYTPCPFTSHGESRVHLRKKSNFCYQLSLWFHL